MRRTSPLLSCGEAVDMDSAMTPMIDVVFLLLVFFVWTASFIAAEQVLPSELSSQLGDRPSDAMTADAESDFDPVVVKIDWNETQPTWRINQRTYPQLIAATRQLQNLAAAAIATPIIVHPQPGVPLGHVIETYDAVKRCGFDSISFAVNAK